MQKFVFGCPTFSFLAEKRQINILQLNYDCYAEIFSYLNTLEDQLNFARAHPQFREVVARQACQRYGTINKRMLKTIPDWEFLLQMCGESVIKCEVLHGRWDKESITPAFVGLLSVYCPNLKDMVVIFVHSEAGGQSGEGDIDILQLLKPIAGLKSLTLTDPKAFQLAELPQFTTLESLELDGHDVHLEDEKFLQLFHSMNNLRQLTLRFGRGFKRSRQVPELANCCPLLEHLTLDYFCESLEHVGNFESLKSLHLLCRYYLNMNDQLLRSLAQNYAERLEQLQLKAIRITLEHVVHIVKLKRLKAFTCDKWPSEALADLSQLNELECLSLRGGKGASEVVAQLKTIVNNCTNLEHIKLGKDFQMSPQDVERFVSEVKDNKGKLLLTLEFVKCLDVQAKLTVLCENQNNLHVSFHRVNCRHCHWDVPSFLE